MVIEKVQKPTAASSAVKIPDDFRLPRTLHQTKIGVTHLLQGIPPFVLCTSCHINGTHAGIHPTNKGCHTSAGVSKPRRPPSIKERTTKQMMTTPVNSSIPHIIGTFWRIARSAVDNF